MADVVYRIEVVGLGGENGSSQNNAIEKPQGAGSQKNKAETTFRPSSLKNVLGGDNKFAEGLIGAGIYLGTKSLSTYLRTIGLRSGNSYEQQNVDFGLNIAQNIFGGAITGAMTGGLYGALAGVVGGIAKTGVDAIIGEYTAGIKRDWNIAGAMETQRVMNYASFGNNRTGGTLY